MPLPGPSADVAPNLAKIHFGGLDPDACKVSDEGSAGKPRGLRAIDIGVGRK
jgi:hypothetical protein